MLWRWVVSLWFLPASLRKGRAYHDDEVLCGHLLPDLVEEGAVVDAEGGGDAFAQAVPVFAVVRVGPLVDGGHAALHLWRRGGSAFGRCLEAWSWTMERGMAAGVGKSLSRLFWGVKVRARSPRS